MRQGGGSRLLITDTIRYKYYSLDITDDDALHDIMFHEKPDVVVHTAAMTRVDDCELKRDESFKINVLGTSFALSNAEKFSGRFIHISTDFVFDGEKGNYKEDDALGFVNWYGFTKIEAEELVSAAKIPTTIIRTCLVYGNALYGTRNNIISWVKDKLEKNEKIKVVDDQVRTPTYVRDLADGILQVIKQNANGIFHISGKDVLTPYAMALQTAEFFSLDKNLIEKVNASNFAEPARRPKKQALSLTKQEKN